MAEKKVLPLDPAYNELSHLLFMLQMSYINPTSIDATAFKSKIDRLIAVIHANNIIDNELNNKV